MEATDGQSPGLRRKVGLLPFPEALSKSIIATLVLTSRVYKYDLVGCLGSLGFEGRRLGRMVSRSLCNIPAGCVFI